MYPVLMLWAAILSDYRDRLIQSETRPKNRKGEEQLRNREVPAKPGEEDGVQNQYHPGR